MQTPEPTKAFCVCDGAGCRKCKGFGWIWSDGVIPEECRPGVACGRTPKDQCPTCPHKEKMKIRKDD